MAGNSFSSGSWQDDASSTRSSLSSTSSDPIFSSPIRPTIDQHQGRTPWIISHVLECHLSYELPLRIMFSFNAGYRVPTLKEAHKWWQYEPKGTAIIKFLISLEESKLGKKEGGISKDKDNRDESIEAEKINHVVHDPFTDPHNETLLDVGFASEFSDGKRASRGLPPDFIRKWCLDKVFTKVEEQVDFSQALTGIDYLQDLECRRREALREVALRLNIDKNNWKKVLSADPDAKKWVEDIQAQETIIEDFYATCFIDLRIWTMLHELKTLPFYKPNVIAMLNTLYPPCIRELPNNRIDPEKLRKHRSKFYNLMVEVSHRGIGALNDFELHLKNSACKHNWIDTRENLKDYIELASKMIEQSNAVHDIMFFKKSTAIAYGIRSAQYRSPTASSSISARTERQDNKNEQSAMVKDVLPGPKIPTSRLHSRSITEKIHSHENSSNSAINPGSPIESQSSGRGDRKLSSRKRLASPKRHHEYSQEYHTIPMNAPRILRSVATTPNLSQNQSFSTSTPPNAETEVTVPNNQHTRPRANTPFMEQQSEAVQYHSFQPWVPLKDQHQKSKSCQTSYPDPWSRGPPNPKYQQSPRQLSEDEKLLQVLRRGEAPIRRRASFTNGIHSSSRLRASSVTSTKIKSHRVYKDNCATSFETLRAGSPPNEGFSTIISPRKQVEKALKSNPSAIQAYQALDLRELPGYPSIPKAVALENTQRPRLRKQKSYGSSGGLRGRAMSDFALTINSQVPLQQDALVTGTSRKLRLRKTPLRESSTDIRISNLSPAFSDSDFPTSKTTPALTTPRIKLRKMPLDDTTTAEMQTPSSPLSIRRSPLPLGQEIPITPGPEAQLRNTALHNSSLVGVQTQNTSSLGSKSPLPPSLDPTTTSRRMEIHQKGKKLTKLRPKNGIQCDFKPDSLNKNMNCTPERHWTDTTIRKPTLPELSPNVDLSFLDNPYEPPNGIQPRLKKKSSMATIFRRKSIESLKSVRFEDTETSHDIAGLETARTSSEGSKTSIKSSVGSKFATFNGCDNALGISIPDAQSSTTLSHISPVSTSNSFMSFPPPLPAKQALKKQKSLGFFPHKGGGSVNDLVDLPKQPILKKQKSLGLFPRSDSGKDKGKAIQPTQISVFGDMDGIFDGSQQGCTAYCPHTAFACREPYRFPAPPSRVPTQVSTQNPVKSHAPSTKTPIINDYAPKLKPTVRINTANKFPVPSDESPISPENKLYGFIPPPLKKSARLEGWETDLDIALEQEHRANLEHAKAQSQPTSKHRASLESSIDTITSNDSNQLRKTTSKLSKTTSFAEDTPNLPPQSPGSTKFGSFFMNAGANISAAFVGKNKSHALNLGKSPKIPVSILSKKDIKEKPGKSYEGTIRKDRTGTLASLIQTVNPSHIFTKHRRHQPNKSLTHKHKPISRRKREALLRRHFRIKAHTIQRYKQIFLLEDSTRTIYAEGIRYLDHYRPFVRESPELYRRKEFLRSWLLEVSRVEREGGLVEYRFEGRLVRSGVRNWLGRREGYKEEGFEGCGGVEGGLGED
ncbi:ef576bc7-2172-4d41-97de-92937d1cfbe6 [Sclerotinia trifoliorum]|uniref:Ef576bc7-2172-4d41-97de-92937d1cfbe6 n=1 Tax=Sclerotinia trifoliorum TaxID=28548 RepID=A0A8H2VRW9_9HELO|nr:ef576bc7-2172-4d41-97de-92937d1cfbe6 [Sclerotinia trifoliorum]